MTSHVRGLIVAVAISITTATTAAAAAYLVPSDEELVGRADTIVHGRVVFTQSILMSDGTIVTDTTIEATSVLKGAHRDRYVVRDEGGVVGSRAMGVSGWAGYAAGETVLAFLEQDGARLRTWGLALGKFSQTRNRLGEEIFLRGAGQHGIFGWDSDGDRHVDAARAARPFLTYIRSVVTDQQRFTVNSYTAAGAVSDDSAGTVSLTPDLDSHYPPSAYTQGTFRWDRFDKSQSVSFYISGSQPGYDWAGAAQRGLAAWTNEPNSNISYTHGGSTSAGFVQDGISAIVFNSSTDVPSGAIGYARWWANAEHTYKGEKFWSISEGDIVMRSNLTVSQKVFDEAVTHELGHTLGFRHSDAAAPASSQAVMNSTVTGNYGATLGPWDVEAVTHVYTGSTTASPAPASNVKGDFNGDGLVDILLRNYTTGQNAVWIMNGTTLVSIADLPALANTSYRMEGTADFSGDGRTDVLLRNYATGQNAVWLMNGTALASVTDLPALTNLALTFAGTGDFNGDGQADILLRNQATGANAIWLMNSTRVAGIVDLPLLANVAYQIEGSGDFNGDGHADIVLRNYSTGQNAIWLMNRTSLVGIVDLPALPNTSFRFEGVGDFNRDGRSDIVIRNYSTGQNAIWLMNGTSLGAIADLPHLANLSYEIGGPR